MASHLDRARIATAHRKRKTVRYQSRQPGLVRVPLMTLLTPTQRVAIRLAAHEANESVSFVLAAIVAAYFGD